MSEHITVLLHEAVQALAVRPNGIYVDGTYGRGGHSRLILSNLDQQGRLIAFDKDVLAVESGEQLVRERRNIRGPGFTIRHAAFSEMQQILSAIGVHKVDGILLDLGISSPQLEAERGFSFQVEGPLDMRMDITRGLTATRWIETVSETELERVIREYGEERYARQIARALVMARTREPIATTRQLAGIVAAVIRSHERKREGKQNPATRTFQAIRIAVNQELEELSLVLRQSVDLLNPGGRLVVISFHSLEDRIVKRFMRKDIGMTSELRNIPLRESELRQINPNRLKVVGKAIRPKQQEISTNKRSRSAVMRVAERT